MANKIGYLMTVLLTVLCLDDHILTLCTFNQIASLEWVSKCGN